MQTLPRTRSSPRTRASPACMSVMHTLCLQGPLPILLLVLLSTATAAAAPADGSALGGTSSGSTLQRPHQLEDNDHTYAQLYGGDSASLLADPPALARRHLLHGPGNPWWYPKCARCKLIGCSNGYFTGHCRAQGQLKKCVRKKTGTSASGKPMPETSTTLSSGPPGPPPPPPPPPPDDAPTPAYLPCMHDSDCVLPSEHFAEVNGSAPVSADGVIDAYCAVEGASDEDSPEVKVTKITAGRKLSASSRKAVETVDLKAKAAPDLPPKEEGRCMCRYSSRSPNTVTIKTGGKPGSSASARATMTSSAPKDPPKDRASSRSVMRSSTAVSYKAAQKYVSDFCVLDLDGDHPTTTTTLSGLASSSGSTQATAGDSLTFDALGTGSCSISFNGGETGLDFGVIEDAEVGEVVWVYDDDFGDLDVEPPSMGATGGDSKAFVAVAVRQDRNETEVTERAESSGDADFSLNVTTGEASG